MTIIDVLQNTKGDAKKWVENLQDSLSKEIPRLWVPRVNDFLGKLPSDQIDLISNKLKNVSDTYRLIDKLVEILVATEYQDEQPEFQSENIKGPDILLKRSSRYIEVKNVNNSDEYKDFWKHLRILKTWSGACTETEGELEAKDKKRYASVLKKAKEKIDIGIDQLDTKKGFIYLTYSIDLSNFSLESSDQTSVNLEKDLQKYCSEKKIHSVFKKTSELFD